jgi:dihydrofolate synthase/folylpolyglutamate synthase
MTYEKAREFIDQSNQYGNELGLEKIKELLTRLGNPQDKVKVVHVAGTNGKGSTTAFITAILSSEGYRVGRYISPAVFNVRETIQITKRVEKVLLDSEKKENTSFELVTDYITEKGICDAIKVIKPICEAMLKEGLAHPTPFEIETAMAFLHFYWEQVDFAVIEVGLGGRLDATNVMTHPICCVITSISMDHMQYLGNDLKQITMEKAGIIKKASPVVTGNKTPEILQVLEHTCKSVGTNLLVSEVTEATRIQYSPEGTTFLYKNQEYIIGLLGSHQIENALLAIHAVEVIRQSGYSIREHSIRNGLSKAKWSGRFEIIAQKPYLIIDGAHNEDAALQLKEAIQLYFSDRRIIYIMGIFADKDYRKVLEITASLAEVVITITPNNSRALASSQLAIEAKQYGARAVIDAGSVKEAIKFAYEEAREEDVIIAFGSLSFLGELREIITW